MIILNKYNRNPNLLIRRIEEEYYVILDNKVYKFNYFGMVILKYIGSDISISDLAIRISEFCEHNDVSEVLNDITKFIEYMLLKELIYE